MATSVFTPSGVKIDVLSTHDGGEYYMVRSVTTGKVFIAHKDQVAPAKEDTEVQVTAKSVSGRRGRRGTAVVTPQVPVDHRLNLNNLTPEGLTQALPGVGLKTAQEIVDLRRSLPGERFTKLEQLKDIKRVDWDEVFATGAVYVE